MVDVNKTIFDLAEGDAPLLTDLAFNGQDPLGVPVLRRTFWSTIRNLFMGTPSAAYDFSISLDGSTFSKQTLAQTQTLLTLLTPGGRLTLESGVPVSTTDQVDKTTLYYTPHIHNRVPIYNGTIWESLVFAELSLDISAYTASKPYDIWIYNNAGTATLDSTVWTNATTRATALVYQDGRLVKSGATTRLYLGTIYMDAASKCQDTVSLRYVWNYYNRKIKSLFCTETTDNWTYTTATWRATNNNTTNGVGRVSAVIGVAEDISKFISQYIVNNTTGAYASGGIGINSTSVNSAQLCGSEAVTSRPSSQGLYSGILPVGLNYIQRLEISSASGTTYWYGDNNLAYWATGMLGEILA